MKEFETRYTEKQLSRWLATALIASSVLLGAAVVLAQSVDRRSPSEPATLVQAETAPSAPGEAPLPSTNPASPVAPPAVTPATDDPPAPRTSSEVATDQAIAERVRVALASDHLTRSQPIDITVTRGIANLSGSVSTEAVAHRALSIARGTGGVTAVQDAMKIEEEATLRDKRR
jgi:type IV secretory pathway VirB10-like protein